MSGKYVIIVVILVILAGSFVMYGSSSNNNNDDTKHTQIEKVHVVQHPLADNTTTIVPTESATAYIDNTANTVEENSSTVPTTENIPIAVNINTSNTDVETVEEYIDPNIEILRQQQEHLDHAAELDSMRAFQATHQLAPPITATQYAERIPD